MREGEVLSHTDVFYMSGFSKHNSLPAGVPESWVALWEEQKGNMSNCRFWDGSEKISQSPMFFLECDGDASPIQR